MIKQFLTDVMWGERDYLVIDTPPGTSDEHITVVEQLKNIRLDGAIVVTTPQVRGSHFSRPWLIELSKMQSLAKHIMAIYPCKPENSN